MDDERLLKAEAKRDTICPGKYIQQVYYREWNEDNKWLKRPCLRALYMSD